MAAETKGIDYITLLIVGVAICCLYLLYQNNQLHHESLALQERTIGELAVVRKEVVEMKTKQAEMNIQAAQVSGGGSRQQFASALNSLLQNINLAKMKNGLYQVKAPVSLSLGAQGLRTEKEYTIYHIKTEVTASGTVHPFHAGIATSGYLTAPKLYVDYNGDGAVDLHAMYEIITWLPFHKLISRSVNPVVSQEVYIAFLKNFRSAEFTEVASISEHGSYLVRGLWQVISEKGAEIVGFSSAEAPPSPDEEVGRF